MTGDHPQGAVLRPEHFTVSADPDGGVLVQRVRSDDDSEDGREFRSAGPVGTVVTVGGREYRQDYEYELPEDDAEALDGIVRRAFAAMAEYEGLSLGDHPDQPEG